MIPLSPSPTSRDTIAPFIEQCDVDGERRTWPRPVWHESACGYCAKPIALEDCISFISDTETRVSYPNEHADDGARAVLEHMGCGPDIGYWIPLKRLSADGLDGPNGWVTHLQEKPWFGNALRYALTDAHALATRLRDALNPPAAPEREWLPPKLGAVTERPSRVSSNPRSITTRTRTRVMERDGFKCRRCGAGPDAARLVVDHIVPVAKGGTAEESNLQTLCHPCNAGKSDREPHEHDTRARGEV